MKDEKDPVKGILRSLNFFLNSLINRKTTIKVSKQVDEAYTDKLVHSYTVTVDVEKRKKESDE